MVSNSPHGSYATLAAAAQAQAAELLRLRNLHTVVGESVPTTLSGYPGRAETATLSPEMRLRYVYILGATGSGKTNLLLLLYNDILNGVTVILVDLRGDLVDRVLRWLAARLPPAVLRERLVLIDLRDGRYAVPLNPLAGAGEPFSRALYTLAVLRELSDSWGVTIDEALRFALLALAEAGGSLLDVARLLSDAPFCATVLAGTADPLVLDFFERYWQTSGDKRRALRAAVLNKITPLVAIPRLRRAFGLPGHLPLGDLLNDRPGTNLLAALGADQLHGAARLAGRLFVTALENAVMGRANRPPSARPPVMLFVDEFQNLVGTDRFEAILAEGRRFGLGLTVAHQNLAQLPTALRESVRNNAGTQFYFRTGAGDAADVSRELVTSADREELVRTLLSQPVGEAFLVPKGRDSCRIRVPQAPDPHPGAAAVAAARAAGYARFAITGEHADTVLAAPPAAAPAATVGGAGGAGSGGLALEGPAGTKWEVRDGLEQGLGW